MASQKLLVFDIGGEDFGVDIASVDSIQEAMDIYKVPNMPACIEGLINLRGRIYTVFNLRKKFNLPVRELDGNSKIIIINYENMMVGFIVDQVNEIVTLDDEDIEQVPEIISRYHYKYMSGIAKKGEKIILILDLTKILSASEEEAAAAIAKEN